MKEKTEKFKNSGVFMILIMLLCAVFGVYDGSALTADAVITPEAGGAILTDASLKATDVRENSERLILDTIDEKVTKVRPHDAVLDTLSRHVTDKKQSNSQIVRHYAIDVIDLTAELTASVTAGVKQTNLTTSNNEIFASEQTIFCIGIQGYKADHVTVDPDNELMLYVVGKNSNGEPLVVAVNGTGDGTTLPAIPSGTKLLRGGRAGSETQIQTDPYSGVPTDWEQYLQKFMAQIELSELFQRTDKEVDWEFTDAEEEAVYDMKRVQNITYWKGSKGRIKAKNAHTQKAEDIFFTHGIWTQAGKDFSFGGVVDSENMVTFMKTCFIGNASGKQKIFLVGSDLLEKLEQVEYTKIIKVGDTKAAHGLVFNTMVSKFGTLLIAHDQSLDEIGWSNRGFVLDADFLRKWTMGWRVTNFDFRKSGQSDSDGRGLMEICGLVLKNPMAHTRVTFN